MQQPNFQALTLYSGPGLMPPTSGAGFMGPILFPLKTDVALINDSILQICCTNPGERWMRPLFGAGLSQLLFETVPVIVQRLAQMLITQAVAAIDPRITVTSVSVRSNLHKVTVSYQFQIVQVGLNGAGFIEFPRQQ